jgi:adenylate kinase family enzyme
MNIDKLQQLDTELECIVNETIQEVLSEFREAMGSILDKYPDIQAKARELKANRNRTDGRQGQRGIWTNKKSK